MSKEEILKKLDKILDNSDFQQQKEKTKYIVLSIYKELNLTDLNLIKDGALIETGNSNFIKGDKLNLISDNKIVRNFNIKDISKYKILPLELLKLKKSYIEEYGKETNNLEKLLKVFNKKHLPFTISQKEKFPKIGDVLRTKKNIIGKVVAIIDNDIILKNIKNNNKNLTIKVKDIDIIYFDNEKGIKNLITDVNKLNKNKKSQLIDY